MSALERLNFNNLDMAYFLSINISYHFIKHIINLIDDLGLPDNEHKCKL